jgi:hypothetical protein
MWIEVPTPLEANVSSPAWTWQGLITSRTELTGSPGYTTSTFGGLRQQDHRHEVLLVVEGHLRVEARVDRVRAHGAHVERVAVGWRLGRLLAADVAARAGLVLDDDRLSQALLELSAIARADRSVEPAGGKPTISLIGLLG